MKDRLVFGKGENNLHTLCFGGGWLWAGCSLNPSLILRIDPSLREYRAVRFREEGGLHHLSWDGERIWAVHASGHLSRIDPATCAIESMPLPVPRGWGAFGYVSLCVHDDVYVGVYTEPYFVLRVNRSTLAGRAYPIHEATRHSIRALAWDGRHLWIALYTVPGKIVVLDPDTGVCEIIRLDEGDILPTSIIYDGHRICVGLDTMPARIVNIEPGTRERETIELGAGTSCVRSLIGMDGALYAGLYTRPGEVVRMDASADRRPVFTLGAGLGNVRELASDGACVWAGLQNTRFLPSAVCRITL